VAPPQRLGDVLAELDEFAAATWAGARPGDDHTLARQVRRQRRAHRLLAEKLMTDVVSAGMASSSAALASSVSLR
jgi:hypothetical protein